MLRLCTTQTGENEHRTFPPSTTAWVEVDLNGPGHGARRVREVSGDEQA